jgi:hypothetical protein
MSQGEFMNWTRVEALVYPGIPLGLSRLPPKGQLGG